MPPPPLSRRWPRRNRPLSERFLSVLIVNYNGGADLAECLKALARQTMAKERFEVIVLDNASTDGSAVGIQNDWPALKWLHSERNLGFAEGNNRAAEFARGTHWVLLNPDTIPDRYWLEELDRAIEENPGCGIASKLVLLDNPGRLNSAGLFLLKDGRGADRGFRQPDDGRYEAGGEVFAGCAAALAIPRLPTSEPLFDPRLFLYSEDLELGWRRQRAGFRTVFSARAVVAHRVGGSGGNTGPTFAYHTERNRAILAVKYGDTRMALLAGPGLIARTARSILRRDWDTAAAMIRATVDFIRMVPTVLRERRRLRRCESS